MKCVSYFLFSLLFQSVSVSSSLFYFYFHFIYTIHNTHIFFSFFRQFVFKFHCFPFFSHLSGGKQFNTSLRSLFVRRRKRFVWKNNGIVKFYYVIHPSFFASHRIKRQCLPKKARKDTKCNLLRSK